MENLLEKQLIMEKSRITSLTEDNQRLISQNISLCQAIKEQKSLIDNIQSRNKKLQEQVSKLYLTIN